MHYTYGERPVGVRAVLFANFLFIACMAAALPVGFQLEAMAGERSFEHSKTGSSARTKSVKPLRAVYLEPKRRARRTLGINNRLVQLLRRIEDHYGRKVHISSGCRSKAHNRRVGGVRKSFHLRCMAADIKVAGISKAALLRFVRRLKGRGGVGTYCRNSIVHIDVGPRREWHQHCRRRKKA